MHNTNYRNQYLIQSHDIWMHYRQTPQNQEFLLNPLKWLLTPSIHHLHRHLLTWKWHHILQIPLQISIYHTPRPKLIHLTKSPLPQQETPLLFKIFLKLKNIRIRHIYISNKTLITHRIKITIQHRIKYHSTKIPLLPTGLNYDSLLSLFCNCCATNRIFHWNRLLFCFLNYWVLYLWFLDLSRFSIQGIN